MPTCSTWCQTLAVLLLWSIWTAEASAVTLTVVTGKRTITTQMATATDCFNAANRIRASAVKRYRFYCDGRKV